MLSAHSAPHARETHAGRQCADRRKGKQQEQRTLHAKYIDKIHNSTLGGEISTIQTDWKTLTCCIRLGGPFAGPGSPGPLDPGPANGPPRRIQHDGFPIQSVLSIYYNGKVFERSK